MKTYFKIGVVLTVILSILSCQDFLEEDPQGLLTQDGFFKSEKNLELGVIGLYDNLNDNNMYGFNIGVVGELGTDTYTTSNRSGNDIENIDDYIITASNNFFNEIWIWSYRLIARCNFYIEGVQGSVVADEPLKAQYMAEARALRALCYFNLVQFFGDVPLSTVPASDLQATFTRDPKEDVYNQIISDLVYAKENLPVRGNYIGRLDKGVAHGLLIKVYLTMAGKPLNLGTEMYQKGLEEAEEFIALADEGTYRYRLLSPYKEVFFENNERNDEIIFDAQALPGNEEGSRWGKWGGYSGNQNVFDAAGFGAPRQIPSFYATYSSEDNDRRLRNATDSVIKNNGGFRTLGANKVYKYTIAKFRPDLNSFSLNGQYAGFETPRDIPVLRYDDVLLMAAELENEVNGPTARAYEWLNRIRTRAKTTPYDGSNFQSLYPTYQAAPAGIDISNPQDAFREAIFWERAWELAYEGHRRNDLNRWGRLISTVQNIVPPAFEAINNSLNDKFKIISPINIQSYHTLLPIPLEQINITKNDFQQNPGY